VPKEYVVAHNKTRGTLVASKVEVAADYDARTKGLLGRDSLPAGEGLWLVPCPMIHTFFMRFSIDVVFLDRELKAAHVIEDMKPWRMSRWVIRARTCLELPGGYLKGSVKVGDQLEFKRA
jgi:uncharacterized membrane protein (UPF0127 family)